MRIDHVIYATVDLDAAAARVESELGLQVRAGGRHDGLGTHNRIVPLGGGYLELLAVADPKEAASSDFGRGLLARLAEHGDGLLDGGRFRPQRDRARHTLVQRVGGVVIVTVWTLAVLHARMIRRRSLRLSARP